MLITVRDNNVDQALRALKKKLQRESVQPRSAAPAKPIASVQNEMPKCDISNSA